MRQRFSLIKLKSIEKYSREDNERGRDEKPRGVFECYMRGPNIHTHTHTHIYMHTRVQKRGANHKGRKNVEEKAISLFSKRKEKKKK